MAELGQDSSQCGNENSTKVYNERFNEIFSKKSTYVEMSDKMAAVKSKC